MLLKHKSIYINPNVFWQINKLIFILLRHEKTQSNIVVASPIYAKYNNSEECQMNAHQHVFQSKPEVYLSSLSESGKGLKGPKLTTVILGKPSLKYRAIPYQIIMIGLASKVTLHKTGEQLYRL